MSAALTAQPGLHSTATAISMKAKVMGKNRKRKKSTMTGEACATRLISYLQTPLSIPFLGPCILPTLIPVPLISFIIPVYYLYSSFHLRPSSRPLVSPFILFSTCSLILDHVLPVFYSHHGHPSPGSRISLIFVSSLVLTQLGPCSLSL